MFYRLKLTHFTLYSFKYDLESGHFMQLRKEKQIKIHSDIILTAVTKNI